MLYNKVECPTCGNLITVKAVREPQKCPLCKRPFKVIIKRRNKNGKKAKYQWKAEVVNHHEYYAERRRALLLQSVNESQER